MADFSEKKLVVLNYFITTVFSLCGLFLIVFWFSYSPEQKIKKRIPNIDNALLNKLSVQKINIKGTFVKLKGIPSQIPGMWPGFRGDFFDNVSRENIVLKESLDSANLPIQWSVKLGEGYAGAAVRNGAVYLLDYDKVNQSDTLRCFSFDDGAEIWRRAYKVSIKRNHGISRTVPAVSDKYVVTIGPKCQVMCVDVDNGDYKWGIDLVTEYNTTVPLWYTAQCPLIEGSTAILAPAGKVLLMGIDCESGQVVFETPNEDNWKMSHSSIIPMSFYGQKVYVYCAIGGIVGVLAEGADRGKILFKTTEWNHSVVSPSPVQISEDSFLVTAGYGAGSMIFKVVKENNNFKIEKIAAWDKKIFACEQHTPIFYKNYLFTVMPNDAGELKRQLICIDPSGKLVWNSGRDNRFGLGPFIVADDKIFVVDDAGVLTIVKADSGSYQQLSQVKVLSGRESWAPIAITNGRMLLRDFEQLICLNLKEE